MTKDKATNEVQRRALQLPTISQVVETPPILIFPGNISQYANGISAFGLDTDQKRLIRLFFQPVLVLWALWSTGVLKRLFSMNANTK